MKRTLPVGILLLSAAFVNAQPYGNEWINFDRQYWRFEIKNEGIYRIDSAALAAVGFPVATVDPRDLQLFNRGKQVPIYVAGEGDGVFNGGDIIEFHGQGNDAWLDVGLWDDPAHVNNPYFSQYNDSIRYFLTWDATTLKLRVAPYGNYDFVGTMPRDWFFYESIQSYTGSYQRGKRTGQDATNAWMVEGEGWFNASTMSITTNTPPYIDLPYTLSTPSPLTSSAPDARWRLVVAGINNPGGMSDDHHFQVFANGDLEVDTTFSGYQLNTYDFTTSGYFINGGGTTITLRLVHDLPLADVNYPDRQAVAYMKALYGRTRVFNFSSNVHMQFANGADDPMRFDFENIYPGPLLYVFNGDSVRRCVPQFDGTYWKVLFPADPLNDSTHCYFTNEQNVDTITVIEPVTASGYFTKFSEVNADSALLIVSDQKLMNPTLEYAIHRETSPTNPHPTVVADIDELYDQYGGGIRRHPLSIRRWCDHMQDLAASDPIGLFLVGKSVQAPRVGTVQGHRHPTDTLGRRILHVPTFGYPPSDVCFTLGLQGDESVYEIPVGRLSARDEGDVYEYLAKVQTFEGYLQPEKWMKNILHFRGGFTVSEWVQFGAALNAFKAYAEDTSFCGKVTTFVKNSPGVIEMASADSVAAMIEEGVTLMTFFAHASVGGGYDINIDNVNNYEWNGHYPAVIGNSCYSGNIHLTYNPPSSSESFVLADQKGAIAFLAGVDVGFPYPLQHYTTEFYRSFSQVNYGGSIGEHMKHSAFEQLSIFGSQIEFLSNVQTFTLHGDPSLVLNSFDHPDFEIEDADISVVPANVTADIDTFLVAAAVTNIGKGTEQPVVVSLTRTKPDGSAEPTVLTEAQMHFSDTVVFEVPVLSTEGGLGPNQFEVRVDLDPNEITEHVETLNNVAHKQVLISSGDILPVWPFQFAIIPNGTPVLKASTVDVLAPARNYLFQIDTTDSYDSPIMQSTMINAPGGVVSWAPPGIFDLNTFQDSTVFFWRCSPDSVGSGEYHWNESSFQYIEGKEGWGQAHFFQMKNNSFPANQLIYDKPGREFEYYQGQHNIRAQVQGNSSGAGNDNSHWYVDLEWQDGNNACGPTPAWMVCVVDPATFEAWGTPYDGANPDHDFGQRNAPPTLCRQRVEHFFIFQQSGGTSASQLDSMALMLQNEIPDGHYVMIYTWKYLDRDGLAINDPDNSALNALIAMGAPNLAAAPDSVPYIFFMRKGYGATAIDTMGTALNSVVSLSVWVDSQGNVGQMVAPMAGPALAWHSLFWNEVPRNVNDSSQIRVTGISNSGSQQLLMDLQSPWDEFLALGSLVDTAEFPWLRLSGYFADFGEPDPEPAQLERWQLLYDPAPEAALDPPSGYVETLDSLYEGQFGQLAIAVRNISPVDMDSMLVTAWVTDNNNVTKRIHYRYNAPLPVGGVLMDTIHIDTEGLVGINTIRIEANPIDTLTGEYDQIEQYHFNNIAELQFLIRDDDENPVLDVTFDGIHILENDVVSARPEIQITLDDENLVLLLDAIQDTAHFKVFLTPPDGIIEQVRFISGGVEVMQFVPATAPDNICKILYHPIFTEDGVYTLRVQASDISFNQSGDEDYEVRFEVINRPTITNVLNYPNPFTTSTRFVFTLTGTEAPTAMKIQIYTVSGRVIRTIDLHELGPIHVGRNITEYAWDGTDQFGDKLARGVYLYRVFAQLHGQDIEHRDTGADTHFTKGFGKMYLLR